MWNVKGLIPLLMVAALVGAGCEDQCAPCSMKAGDSSADATDVVLFEMMDKDGDHQVTLEEYKLDRKQFFAELDENGDGSLTRSEFRDAMGNRFGWHDVNNDGDVTREEVLVFAVGYTPKQVNQPMHPKESDKSAFLRMDVDQNGILSKDELAGEASLWHEMADHDNDGVRTKSEFDKQMAVLFARMDKNGDGTVSRQEFLLFFYGK